MGKISRLIVASIWIIGIVIAKGFWSTFFAVIFPLWDLYLVLEKWAFPFLEI